MMEAFRICLKHGSKNTKHGWGSERGLLLNILRLTWASYTGMPFKQSHSVEKVLPREATHFERDEELGET